MSAFSDGVVKIVQSIPSGKVMSYGQVALYLGLPRAARQVGWTLNRLEGKDMPWWRVVNNTGRVSIKSFNHSADEQGKLLKAEGLEVGEDLTFDIEKYRFIPSKKQTESWRLPSISKKVQFGV